MTPNEIEVLHVVLYDLGCLVLDKTDKDSKYHYKLAVGNLKDVLNGKHGEQNEN